MASWLLSTCISTFCLFVGEFDLPLGTDIDIVGVAWYVRDVLPPTQHGYRECWRGWFVGLFVKLTSHSARISTMSEWLGLFVMFYLLLSTVIRNVGEVGWFVNCFNLTSNSVRFSAIFDLGCFFVCLCI